MRQLNPSSAARAGVLVLACISTQSTTVARFSTLSGSILPQRQGNNPLGNKLLGLRGGVSKRRGRKKGARTASLHSSTPSAKTATGKKKVGAATKENKSALSDTVQKYKSILPLTRIYITLVVTASFLGVVLGEELTQGLLALDPVRVIYGLELWRPLTAACFLGPPSIGSLMSVYYLFEYGSSLERAYGTAQHLIFLVCQIGLLSLLSIVFGQPFFAPSVITSMLHVLSRSMPNQKVKWLIFTVPYWSLPYGLMVSDVLQAGSAAAALPHVLGILTGHFYFFHKFVWPKMGEEDWLAAPAFLTRAFDPSSKNTSKDSVNAALKARKRGKGHKLGRT